MTLHDALYARDLDALVDRFHDTIAIHVPAHPMITNRKAAALRFRDAFFDSVEHVTDYHATTIVDGVKDGVASQAKVKTRDNRIVAYYQTSPRNPHRFRVDLAYSGLRYEGFQRQPTKRTVQGELEAALSGLFKQTITVHPASRTDAGVHALHHVVHVDVDTPLMANQVKRLLNRMLPEDIRILDIQRVPGVFHARYDATGKTYRYRLCHVDDAFRAHLTMRTDEVDPKRLKSILQAFVGTHDFRNFAKRTDKNTVRTLHTINVRQEADETIIELCGEGFLRHMVRMIIARALEDYHKHTNAIKDALNNPEKAIPKLMVPASGLHLIAVHYDALPYR